MSNPVLLAVDDGTLGKCLARLDGVLPPRGYLSDLECSNLLARTLQSLWRKM